MKKSNNFGNYRTGLFPALLFLSNTKVFSFSFVETPPTPVGIEEPPALNLGNYMIPMMVFTVLLAFYILKKNNGN
ncbi:hypothetical protein SAMN05444395_101415 [Flavobacterium fryxellicola]|uniref:Uncharacterized protein n=1 Tax=Flavobacterium fryxellicola TaxID=249352 RepID=A0A167XLM8_9FLAO|nr:hypothetical protein [Flavobacterium fryxellicola]OAB28485.1 hypothetical protein FBFR_07235 [Flavobacterium fryxellicola]SHN52617.1 hypothetical protein SAMN05444395_101415 [Flavobacterium fryxellicola]